MRSLSTHPPGSRHRQRRAQRNGAARVLAFAVLLVSAESGMASVLIVPDDVPTVQAALDAHVDTVLVRAGNHAGTPTVSAPLVLIGIPGEPGFDQPVLAGLSIDGEDIGLQIRGLTLNSQLLITNSSLGSIAFEDCQFMAGIRDISPDPPAGYMSFNRCRIVGDASLQPEGGVTLDSCLVEGHLSLNHWGAQLIVTDCTFRGDGTRAAIGSDSHLSSATITGTVIEGFGSGVAIYAEGEVEIRDNVVRDCSGAGMSVDAEIADISRNKLERCGYGSYYGYGIFVVAQQLTINENTVVGSAGIGIFAGADGNGQVVANVVSGCGEDGFMISGYIADLLEVRNNTSAFNARAGFLSECLADYGRYEFTGNIGFGNATHGIKWSVPQVSVFRCNDWFENGQGAVQGLPPSSEDLALDPLFCNAADADFHLSSASPLLNVPGCGLVGALGAGCGVLSTPGREPSKFRLASVRPSPSRGPFTIEFELARESAISVDVFDVQGRLVASPARGVRPAGRHTVEWSCLAGGARAAGLYLVRYRFPGGQAHRRIVLTP